MGLTNAYRDYVAAGSVSGAPVAFSNANAYLGVGDSATAFAA